MYISQDAKNYLDLTLIRLMPHYNNPVYMRIYIGRLKRLKRLKRNLLTLQPGSNNWDKRVSQIEKLKELTSCMRDNIITSASTQITELKAKENYHASSSTKEVS